MTVRPDFGPEYGDGDDLVPRRQVLPDDQEDEEEREVQEREREDLETEYLEPEDNEAHAPGQVCERCGQVITAQQDARRRPDGRWVHEECPFVVSGLPPEDDSGAPA